MKMIGKQHLATVLLCLQLYLPISLAMNGDLLPLIINTWNFSMATSQSEY